MQTAARSSSVRPDFRTALRATLRAATPAVRRTRLDMLTPGTHFQTDPYPESGRKGWVGTVNLVGPCSTTVTVLDRGGSCFANGERMSVSGRMMVTTREAR